MPDSTGTGVWTGTPDATNKHLNCDEAPSASPDGGYIYHAGHATLERSQTLNHPMPAIPGGENHLALGGRAYVRAASNFPTYNARAVATGCTTVYGPTITPDADFNWRGRSFQRVMTSLSGQARIIHIRPAGSWVGNNVEVECAAMFAAYGPDWEYDMTIPKNRVQVM
jgi:hypothetical protein